MPGEGLTQASESVSMRAWAWANWLAVPLIGIWLATHLIPQAPLIDDMAYWGTRDGILYELTWNARADSYIYSPAFAQVFAPLTALPYLWFHVALEVIQLAAVLWLLGPALTLGFLLVPFLGGSYIWNGNITPLIAFALVKGQHWPALLTKILPAVTIGWYVGARDWRGLRRQLAILGAVVLVSFALWPGAWVEWADALARAGGAEHKGWAIPLALRLPVAAFLAVYAGHSQRKWLLPFAAMLSTADVWWTSAVWLIAVPRLRRHDAVAELRGDRQVARSPGLSNRHVELVMRRAIVHQGRDRATASAPLVAVAGVDVDGADRR